MSALAAFNVHLSVGLTGSGLAATSLLVAGLADERQMVLCFLLGTVGSLLPDIDADNSAPVRVTFSAASIVLAFLTMFSLAHAFPTVLELAAVWLGSYLCYRWLIFALFTRLTTHRGVFHSVPAALLFGFLTTAVGHRAFHLGPLQAWLGGSFVAAGFLLHLLLDEIYSVNVFGARTRKSFGTAFKLYSRASIPATFYVYLATAAAFMATPSVQPFANLALDGSVYRAIAERLVPRQGWLSHRPAAQGGLQLR